MSSRSDNARDDLDRADQVLQRRRRDGLSFSTARRAVEWFFAYREKAVVPNNLHPHGEPGPNGEMVFVSVDGGQGGDWDEILATLSTIGTSMHHLAHDYPRQHGVLVLYVRDGHNIEQIAKATGLATGTVSADVGKAEAYLAGQFRGTGILR